MKASEVAKKLGLRSLQEAADIAKTTANGLSIMHKNNPQKFLCIVAGASAVKANEELKYLLET